MPQHTPSLIQDATPKIVDTLLTLISGVATLTLPILHIKAGNTLIMGDCGSIALWLEQMP